MSKQIKIPDATYDRLKGAADVHYRTIGAQIEWMMDFIGGKVPSENTPSPKNTEIDSLFEKSLATPGGRGLTKGDVLADIRELEASRDEELRYSQDEEYSNKIREQYAKDIQPLWDEYNKMKDE